MSEVARRVAETPYLPLETMEQRAGQQKALANLNLAANYVSTSLEALMNRLMAGSIQVCLMLFIHIQSLSGECRNLFKFER